VVRIHQKNGFASLAEVLVTAVIFTIAAFGIFAAISMLRPQSMDSKQRLDAAYAGKSVIEQLRASVDASRWDNEESPLYPGKTHSTDVGDYTVNWSLEDVKDLGVRALTMNVYLKE